VEIGESTVGPDGKVLECTCREAIVQLDDGTVEIT
jgi:hypothetical protein